MSAELKDAQLNDAVRKLGQSIPLTLKAAAGQSVHFTLLVHADAYNNQLPHYLSNLPKDKALEALRAMIAFLEGDSATLHRELL